MSHFINKCECGIVIDQCRCIGTKEVNTISPCKHIPQNIPAPPAIIPKHEPLSKEHMLHVDEFVAQYNISSQYVKELVVKIKEAEDVLENLKLQTSKANINHAELSDQYRKACDDKASKGKALLKAAGS